MSDILAAFEREQAEEQEREHRLFTMMQEGGGSSHSDEPATSRTARPSSAAAQGRHTHRSGVAGSSHPRGSSSAASSIAAAAASSSAAVAAASSGFAADAADDDAASRFDSDFALRPLLWTSLRSSVPPAEHAELRRLIGVQELERNETLQNEVEALLSIASATQLRNARDKARQAATTAEPAAASRGNSNGSSSNSSGSLFTRAALPDSATRAFLADEVLSLLLSLRSHALRSGILQPDDGTFVRPASSAPSSRGSSAGGNGLAQSDRSASSSSSLAKILPRPETARQKRVLDQMVAQALTSTQRNTHSAGHMMPSSQQQLQAADAIAASAPSSRPASGARVPLTARPSSARQRSMSSLSSGGSTPPPAAVHDPSAASAAAAVLSHSLLSSSTGPDSARSSLVRSLRAALEEERKALLQDVEYLHACLELEIDEAIEVEKQQQQQQQQSKHHAKLTAPSASSASSSLSDVAVSDDPASVSELRALEAQLKTALAAEEVRSHTLALMSGVALAHQADPFAAKSNAVQPLVAPTTVGSSAGGPLKAVRMPSAGRVRPPQSSPTAAVRAIPLSSASSPAASALSPLAVDLAALSSRELMDLNADLFSAGPTEQTAATSSSVSARSSQRPQVRPVIPQLALGALGGSASSSSSSSSSVLLDHFPAGPGPGPGSASPPLSPSDRHSPSGGTAHTAALLSTPIRRTASSVKGLSDPSRDAESKESAVGPALSASPVSSPAPLTSRSASKARSRIQAAQSFQDQPGAH